jgi:parafibromin
MDPLSILRDYCIRGELDQVKAVGNVIHFGSSYQFPKDTNTAFRVWQSGSDYYKLDAVLFVAQTLQVKHTEYIKQARAAEVQNVNLIDRRNLTK